jgi:ribosome-associated protein
MAKLETIVEAALERSAHDPVVMDVSGLTSYTESLVVVSGNSARQVRAISSHVAKSLKAKHEHPLGVEGGDTASWILIDANDAIVHIFDPETREQFDLERLWADAPRIELAVAKRAPSGPSSTLDTDDSDASDTEDTTKHQVPHPAN